jgi:hypothetical protein
LGATDLAPDGSKSNTAAVHSGQLVGAGILAVPGRLGAIFRRNLAVVAALRAIVRGNLSIVDCSHPAVGGLGALSVVCRAIACCSVQTTDRVVARFGFAVAKAGGDVTIPRREPGLPTAQHGPLVCPRILAILRCLRSIFGCDPAVIHGSFATVGGLSAPRVGPGSFVGRPIAVAGGAIPCGPVAITCCVVTRFGLSIT